MNLKKLIDLILITLILIDTILLLTTLLYDFNQQHYNIISYFDLIVCLFLFVDYIHNINNASNQKKYILSNWLDIISILPDIFLNMIFSFLGLNNFTGLIRLLKLVRVTRVLILFRTNIKLIRNFIKETYLDKLIVIVIVFIIFSSALFYYNGTADSLINGFYYVITTLTGVGYGDIVPTTTFDKFGYVINDYGIFNVRYFNCSYFVVIYSKN
ncbi:MAG: potassium channel family protein [Methanobrevibacter sp.]|jgi:voltage-gated potassium channel|nr:potassium channel family protein [Candidatus Methanovirga meridionalis]